MLAFIQRLTSSIFMLLPMSDSKEKAEAQHIETYIGSVCVQVHGGRITFPFLATMSRYMEVENILNYLKYNTDDLPLLKREIRKALSLLNEVERSLSNV